ncbi:glutamyl-tRNA reductase [Chitinilyticum aquatile]|uniref:glutamyl-tRNA reductase n=1 Tax=Chitinilyticum aquatile TaxID=362520 RepID=UPI0004296A8C|nr:glutamyl-tRNA reductase [Chitinilyticum aquatile]
MKLIVLGLNHHTAPLAVRELLAFGPHELGGALQQLVSCNGVHEAMIVSTCNRTELYCNAENGEVLVDWLARLRHRQPAELDGYLYLHEGPDAVRHAYRVACGLDSMVLGETQILGQLKDAERTARDAGSLGLLLNGLFQRAFGVAKDVRSQTRIGAASVSMAAATVRLAERIFPSVSECKVLFIGAGEMIELCATHMHAQKPRAIAVANRTLERGEKLAATLGGEAMLLSELPARIAEFDIVITSTASSLPIVGKGMMERAIKARRHRPVFMVDLAVPRDVEQEVSKLEDVYLFTVDDLSEVVREGLESRQSEAAVAEGMVQERIEEFSQWLASRALVPTIRELRDHAERIQRKELERAKKQLASGSDPELVLEELARQMGNKFLHAPLAALNATQGEQQAELVEAVRRLYRLHEPD